MLEVKIRSITNEAFIKSCAQVIFTFLFKTSNLYAGAHVEDVEVHYVEAQLIELSLRSRPRLLREMPLSMCSDGQWGPEPSEIPESPEPSECLTVS